MSQLLAARRTELPAVVGTRHNNNENDNDNNGSSDDDNRLLSVNYGLLWIPCPGNEAGVVVEPVASQGNFEPNHTVDDRNPRIPTGFCFI